MFPLHGPLVQTFGDMGSQGIGEVLSEGPEHLGEQLPLRSGVVDVLCDRDQGHVMLAEDCQRF